MTSEGNIAPPTTEIIAAYAARTAAVQAQLEYEFELDRRSRERQHAKGFALGLGDRQVDEAKAKLDTALVAQGLAEQAAGGRVFRVPIENLDKLQTQIAKLAKRAAKLELEPVTLTDTGGEIVSHTDRQTGLNVGQQVRYVLIAGRAPQIAGWEFVAALEHDYNDGADKPLTVIRRVPGISEDTVDLTAYRNATALCEHCHVDRRRNNTYLVREIATGQIQQVGSSCLKDFLGHPSPVQYGRYAEFLADFDELCEEAEKEPAFGGGEGPRMYEVEEYLTFVALSIREYGWTPKSAAFCGGRATAEDAADLMAVAAKGGAKDSPLPEQQDRDTAAAALVWVRDDLADRESLSDYEHNLVAVLSGDWLAERRFGIAASVINAHAREQERELERAKRGENAPDPGPFGTVGQRTELTATVTRVSHTEGQYGTTTIVKFITAEGHRLVWFASNDPELAVGEQVSLKGTVKRHSEFQGVNETHLSRCKLLSVQAPEAAAKA